MIEQERQMGVIPSPPDSRDYTLSRVVCLAPVEYPENFEVPVPPIARSQKYNDCVAQAISCILDCAVYKFTGKWITHSAGFIYGNRAETDHKGYGMIEREALSQLQKVGDVTQEVFSIEKEMPEIMNIVNSMLKELLPNISIKLDSYVRLNSQYEIKDYLINYGIPALCAVPLGDSGAHAEALYGWLDTLKQSLAGFWTGSRYWLCRNSYGHTEPDTFGFEGLLEAWGLIFKMEDEKKFTDVLDGMWYTDAIKEAAADGVVNGYPDGTFKPDATITRAEVAVVDIRRKRQTEKMIADAIAQLRIELMNK